MFWPVSASIFFTLRALGAQNIAKKRYMKCTFCLSLVGVLYPSELELPAIRLVQVSPIFSAFTESFLELLRVYSYSVVP